MKVNPTQIRNHQTHPVNRSFCGRGRFASLITESRDQPTPTRTRLQPPYLAVGNKEEKKVPLAFPVLSVIYGASNTR